MRSTFTGVFFFASLFALGMTGLAQDAVKVAPNHYKVLLENDHVRVIENTLPPGAKDDMHTHPSGWYYVTMPGTMKVVHADGKTEIWKARAGESGWLQTEGPHTSENIGKKTMGFVLVEIKSAASPTASKASKPKATKSGRRINARTHASASPV